ncbi:MAG: type II toxin-antitoxin system RelE/ParE family toxin [Longimicrobiales bacterium]
MIEIRWTEQAAQNLEDIKSFISRDSPSYALAVVARLYHAVTQLAHCPDSGRVVPERGVPEIRELVRPPYRIRFTGDCRTRLKSCSYFARLCHFPESNARKGAA